MVEASLINSSSAEEDLVRGWSLTQKTKGVGRSATQ